MMHISFLSKAVVVEYSLYNTITDKNWLSASKQKPPDKAVEYKLGARGLRSIVEAVMMDTMFELPSKKVKKYEVTAQYAQQQLDKAKLNKLETA